MGERMARSQGGQAVNHLVDAHIAYIKTISDLNNDKAELIERIKRLENNIEKLKDAGDLVFIWLLYNRSHIGGLDVDSALREWKQAKKEAKL